MKNLPNRIYLNFGDITKEEFEEADYKEFKKLDEYAVTFCENKVFDNDVEYVRKDAFIEKAYEYLSYHLDTNKMDVNFKFEFIEEFAKYMKGE